MSHFAVLVLAPAGTTRASAEAVVEPMLAPFDENRTVDEHECECPCVGVVAEQAGINAAWTPERAERRERLRRRWIEISRRVEQETHGEASAGLDPAAAIATIERVSTRDGLAAEQAQNDEEWQALIDAARRIAFEVTKNHPQYRQPDPECEECGGSGRWRTTVNPQGFWDWWEIGGRWTGTLDPDYDPDEDARNYSRCPHCQSERHTRFFRTEQHASRPEGLLGIAAVERDGMWEVKVPCAPEDPLAKEVPCNACEQTGISRTFGNAPIDGDVRPLATIPVEFPWGTMFHALVTPDGQWHQEGRMGWFGQQRSEMDEETWAAYIAAEIAKHPDTTAVVIDAHI